MYLGVCVCVCKFYTHAILELQWHNQLGFLLLRRKCPLRIGLRKLLSSESHLWGKFFFFFKSTKGQETEVGP